jgi:predicted amidohydrolase YtcJ
MHYLELDAYEKTNHQLLSNHPYLEFGAVGEIFYDGTLSSQTALMHDPYRDSQGVGQRQFLPEQWVTMVKRIRKLGLPLAVHTIGDLALEEVVETLITHPVKKGFHDRIIHASFAKKITLDKLKRIPVILDVQPQFVTSDLPWASKTISTKTELIYPWKTYFNHGLLLAGGSDAPVEVPDPLKGIHAAYYRQVSGLDKVFQPEERLSMQEAIHLYTVGANGPSYNAKRQGKLLIGTVADFTFVSEDFYKKPETLAKAKVMMTVVNNHIVFKHE